MQFGKTLQRLLQDIVNADPKYGPTYLCKVDISDGFYRVWLNDTDIPKPINTSFGARCRL